MAEPYLTAKINAYALFEGGIRFDDVISVSATFALNSIPTASVVVAVGRAGGTNDSRGNAKIHEAKSRLKPRMRVEVFAEIEHVAGNSEVTGMAEGTYKIFEGYLAGMGYQRSHNHANYVINLVHWLDDLNNSSAINGNWFPGVPHDYAQQAVADMIGANGVVTGFAPVPSVSYKFATPENVRSDLWGKTIKPLMETLAGFAGDEEQKRVYSGGAVKLSNSAAKKALERMPGDGPYVNLGLIVEDGEKNIANSISKFFAQSVGTSFAQNSMWSKIINEYAANFMFAISPAVEWALPIPFCAGLKHGGGAKTITAKEYSFANFNSNMSQLIEAVYVHYPVASATNIPNLATGQNERLSFYRPWASYPDDPQEGLKLFKLGPGWLCNLSPGCLPTLSAARGVHDHGLRDGGKKLPPGVEESAPAHKKQIPTAKRFAQHWYYTEILQQRYGEMSGPLRFDIAPGSVIKIETPPAEKLKLGEKNDFVVASVVSVSYVINAERATAGTSFTIAHTKTKEETENKLYATDSPPLYSQPWFSGPLAEPKGGG